ncbi:MAG: homocysteine S-methyltransferase [Candidatus Limnocylindria bacterium]
MTIVLDGGLATQLEARGLDLSDRLWSARVLVEDPDAIEAVHRAYFDAGARVATTASYQATVQGFEAAGLDRDAALAAIRRSVALARRARDAHVAAAGADIDRPLLVAGSVGPYGAMLADGSEYRGDYDPGPDALREVHAPRMDALLEAGADLLALETIPTMREAEVLVRLVEERGARAWLTYQCRDEASTAAGEPIADAMAVAAGSGGIEAVGVNCTAPRLVPHLLAAAAATAPALARIAYPNAGDRWDATAHRWVATSASEAFDGATVAGWTALGATWLGGCCGTGPADIAALAAAVTSAAPAAAPATAGVTER